MAEATNMSEECDPLLCYPCDVDGKSRFAHGYCDTCHHYLCENCFKAHCIPMIWRNHVMLDYMSMPKENVVPHDPLTEQCEKHGRLLKFYCAIDKDILCSVCVTLNHGNCDVSFIPDEAKNIGNSSEFSRLRGNMSKLIKRVKINKETANRNKSYIEQLKEETRSQVLHIKEELVKYFDKLEMSLVSEIDQIAVSDLSVMDKIFKSCATIEKDLQKLSAELDEKLKKNQNNKLFFAMKKTEKKLAEIQSEIESVYSINGITWYKVEPNVELEHSKISFKTLGRLNIRRYDCKMKGTNVRKFNVKSKSVKRACLITGICVLDEEKVVLCDNVNFSVILFDTKRNEISSQIQLPSWPWDTALLSCNVTEESTRDLIVTLPYEGQLRYIRVTNDQITDTNKVIPVKGRCRRIQVIGDRKLAISYDLLDRVEILDLEGQLLTTIETDNGGARLFSGPRYLAVSPRSDILYVSDWGNGTLTSISTRDWSVMTKLEGLVHPHGVTVDCAGSVLSVVWMEPSILWPLQVTVPLGSLGRKTVCVRIPVPSASAPRETECTWAVRIVTTCRNSG